MTLKEKIVTLIYNLERKKTSEILSLTHMFRTSGKAKTQIHTYLFHSLTFT